MQAHTDLHAKWFSCLCSGVDTGMDGLDSSWRAVLLMRKEPREAGSRSLTLQAGCRLSIQQEEQSPSPGTPLAWATPCLRL